MGILAVEGDPDDASLSMRSRRPAFRRFTTDSDELA
jgi:hypothetical protein